MEVSGLAKSSLDRDCLKKVIAAVNKQHTLAEGSVFAIRDIYTGYQASALLVGHSDETEPTEDTNVDVYGLVDQIWKMQDSVHNTWER